jgi:flagellar export protein FliJ
MKKFSFSLERVLEWRRTQARADELKLETLLSARRSLETRLQALREEPGRSLAEVIHATAVTGNDLAALDRHHLATAAQAARVSAAIADWTRQISAQSDALAARRREVRLLELLRQDAFKRWQREFYKEIDQQAEEAHLARFR